MSTRPSVFSFLLLRKLVKVHADMYRLKQMGLVLSSSSRSYTTFTSSKTPLSKAHPSRPKSTRQRRKPSEPEGITTSQILGGAVAFGLGAVFVGLVWNSFSR